MNERIKLLKHQASLWCDENIPEQFSEETNGYGSAWEDKFAVLIVRECLEQIDKIRDGCEADHEDQQALGADWAGLAVARHFGIE